MRYSKTIKWMIAVFAITATAIIYFLYEPQQHGFYLICPLHYMTGLKCPFCGLQQMIYHILHGQIKTAFLTNPFLFLLIPYVAAYLYFNISNKKNKHSRTYQTLYGDKTLLILLVIALIFGIIRNLIP